MEMEERLALSEKNFRICLNTMKDEIDSLRRELRIMDTDRLDIWKWIEDNSQP